MSINWKTRIENKEFWLALIPATLIFVQMLAAPFGYEWDFCVLNEQLAGIVNAAFALATLLGVVNNPTTRGIFDGESGE